MSCAVILTALPIEYLAVRSHLSDLKEEMHPQGTIYERGTFTANEQTWEVGLAEVGAGNAGAAVEAERAIAYFNPNILLFVGIAGGIKDVRIGDVVAATEIYSYESGKVGNGQKFLVRPKAGKSSYAIIQRARAEVRTSNWLQRISEVWVQKPRAYVAPIVAGEKVLASTDSELFQFLRESYNDAIAVEMEGFGFLSAAFAYPEFEVLVIRGISDLIQDKNADDPQAGSEDERQERASQHASAFAFEVLSKLSHNSDEREAYLLKDVADKQAKLTEIDQKLEPYLSQDLKEALDWLEQSQSGLAQQIVNYALDHCPNLKEVVKRNTKLEDRIFWEFEKYIESIHNALLTKHRDLLDQPAISPFLTREGTLFSSEERNSFKFEEGVFYTLTCKKLKSSIPMHYLKVIKSEFMDYVDNLRDNLPT